MGLLKRTIKFTVNGVLYLSYLLAFIFVDMIRIPLSQFKQYADRRIELYIAHRMLKNSDYYEQEIDK